MNTAPITRYSETDLAEFKALIDKQIEKTEKQLASLETQLLETSEAIENEGDWMDDSSSNNDLEMLQTKANRQGNYLIDLKNALQRIHNKSYGICMITGELIDKRRLLAVPTTTKSLAAKTALQKEAGKKVFKPEVRPANGAPKIISKVISKPKTATKPVDTKMKDWEDDEAFDDDLDFEQEEIDLDNYSEEDIDD